MFESRDSRSFKGGIQSVRTAFLFQNLDRRHIQRISKREPDSDRSVEPVVIIVRMIQTGLSGKIGWHIRDNCAGKRPLFKRPDISERLQRRTGGASIPGAINLTNTGLTIV